MTLNEPPHGRILDATHLAATPLLESVNWLLDAVHQQHLAFGQISEDVQHLQAFKESTELCLKSMKEESAAAGAAGEIAVAYTKDVVERAREASKGASREPGIGVSNVPSIAEEMAQLRNELKQMENDWKTQLANVQETVRTPQSPDVAINEADIRLVALESQMSELKVKLESVVPNADAPVDPVDPVDSNEAPDDEDPATVVNPAITVIQSPAINIQPSERQTGPVMTGGKTTNSPGVTQSAGVGEMNEMNGRMKIMEGQVKRLMEALEVLREILDLQEELPGEAVSAELTNVGAEVATQTVGPEGRSRSAPGSKEVPSSGRSSRPQSRENWKTFSSTLESLDLRVTALEQWRAMGTFHPAPGESTSAEQTAVPEETTVPEQTTVPEDTTVAATAVPEAEEALQMQQGDPSVADVATEPVQVPPLQLPKPSGPTVRLPPVEAEEDLEERLSMLEEMHPLHPEQSAMLNSIVQDVRLCLKRCELILQLPEIKAFIRKFQSSLQVNAVLHDRWLGPKSRQDDEDMAPKVEHCKSMGDLTSVAADQHRRRPGDAQKRPFRTVADWARPHTPLTLDPRSKVGTSTVTTLPEI